MDCGTLKHPLHGKVILSKTVYGSIAKYECEQGYKLVGIAKRTCLGTGVWDHKEPICEGIITSHDKVNTRLHMILYLQMSLAVEEEVVAVSGLILVRAKLIVTNQCLLCYYDCVHRSMFWH